MIVDNDIHAISISLSLPLNLPRQRISPANSNALLEIAREKLGIETIELREYTDVPRRISELVRGLDAALDCGNVSPAPRSVKVLSRAIYDRDIPRTQDAGSESSESTAETDVPETINKTIISGKKQGGCDVISNYVGHTNEINIGALVKKGVR
ncbi:hypothetical protein PM082_012264 [Marasmius tenuissimus]|nr:hypothetical protein PM082_012264 [Marasmius tenuissimus]